MGRKVRTVIWQDFFCGDDMGALSRDTNAKMLPQGMSHGLLAAITLMARTPFQ